MRLGKRNAEGPTPNHLPTRYSVQQCDSVRMDGIKYQTIKNAALLSVFKSRNDFAEGSRTGWGRTHSLLALVIRPLITNPSRRRLLWGLCSCTAVVMRGGSYAYPTPGTRYCFKYTNLYLVVMGKCDAIGSDCKGAPATGARTATPGSSPMISIVHLSVAVGANNAVAMPTHAYSRPFKAVNITKV